MHDDETLTGSNAWAERTQVGLGASSHGHVNWMGRPDFERHCYYISMKSARQPNGKGHHLRGSGIGRKPHANKTLDLRPI